MVCAACSQQMNTEARFCTCCGRPVQQQNWYNAYGYGYGSGPFARVTRPRNGRMIAGVCAALAQREGWDVALVRIVAVLLFFFGCGSALLVYLVAWIALPNEPFFVMPPPSAPASGPSAGVAAS